MRCLSLLLLLLFVGHCIGLPSPSAAAAAADPTAPVIADEVGINEQQSSVTPPLSDSEQLQPIQHSDKATPLAQRARLQWARRIGLGLPAYVGSPLTTAPPPSSSRRRPPVIVPQPQPLPLPPSTIPPRPMRGHVPIIPPSSDPNNPATVVQPEMLSSHFLDDSPSFIELGQQRDRQRQRQLQSPLKQAAACMSSLAFLLVVDVPPLLPIRRADVQSRAPTSPQAIIRPRRQWQPVTQPILAAPQQELHPAVDPMRMPPEPARQLEELEQQTRAPTSPQAIISPRRHLPISAQPILCPSPDNQPPPSAEEPPSKPPLLCPPGPGGQRMVRVVVRERRWMQAPGGQPRLMNKETTMCVPPAYLNELQPSALSGLMPLLPLPDMAVGLEFSEIGQLRKRVAELKAELDALRRRMPQ